LVPWFPLLLLLLLVLVLLVVVIIILLLWLWSLLQLTFLRLLQLLLLRQRHLAPLPASPSPPPSVTPVAFPRLHDPLWQATTTAVAAMQLQSAGIVQRVHLVQAHVGVRHLHP
jgi:hypothetical protein